MNTPSQTKRETTATVKRKVIATQTLEALRELYPHTKPHLVAASPWELLVATMLSAQCTDARVNAVTPELFRRLPTVRDFAAATQAELENLIHSTGFFRNKAKNIISSAKRIIEVYDGKVPESMADLLSLDGVARKTANVVLWGAFGKNAGLAVDTHVARICARLGLCSPPSSAKGNPEAIEKDLCAVFPQDEWGNVNHRMVSFGRDICTARAPACAACPMQVFCPQLLGDGSNKGAGQKSASAK